MGGNASKVSRSSGRVLRTQNARPSNVSAPDTISTRPTQSAKAEQASANKRNHDDGSTVAERSLKLGQAKVNNDPQYKYKPPSEDIFTMTLEARQKLENTYNQTMETQPENTAKKHIPAATITSISTSLKEGDPVERVMKAYNIEPSVIEQLKAVSLPEIPKHNLPNELSQSNSAQRQPVRRKRNTSDK